MTDEQRRVARRYLTRQGWTTGFEDEIHPDDEMYLTLRGHLDRPEIERLIYYRSGEQALLAVEHALAEAGAPLARTERFLEFACGYGRFTRFLVQRLAPERIWAADVLPAAVDTCRERFGVHGFVSAFEPEQVDLPGPFDAIYVGSLFSHLPRARFAAWLAKLYGALAPRGILLFSVHGPHVVQRVEKSEDGFTFLASSETEKLAGEEYGSTFVTPTVVESIARDCGVQHLYRVDRELWETQDLYAATPVALPGLATWRSAPRVWGSIRGLEMRPDGTALLAGFVRWASWAPSVVELRLAFDERDLGAIPCTDPGIAEPAEPHRSAFLHREWRIEGALPDRSPGAHLVEVLAKDADGRTICLDIATLRVEGRD